MNIEDCYGVVPILKKGRNAVTLTIIMRFGRNSALGKAAMEQLLIEAVVSKIDIKLIEGAHALINPSRIAPQFQTQSKGG